MNRDAADDKNLISADAYSYLLDFIEKFSSISFAENDSIDCMIQSKRTKRQREKIKLLKTQGKSRKVIDTETGQIYHSCNQAAHAKGFLVDDFRVRLRLKHSLTVEGFGRIYSSLIRSIWTETALYCYNRHCVCKGCFYRETLESLKVCYVKAYVIGYIRYGIYPKENRKAENETNG